MSSTTTSRRSSTSSSQDLVRPRRNPLACTRCRQRKVRCTPGACGERCERCRKYQYYCEYVPIAGDFHGARQALSPEVRARPPWSWTPSSVCHQCQQLGTSCFCSDTDINRGLTPEPSHAFPDILTGPIIPYPITPSPYTPTSPIDGSDAYRPLVVCRPSPSNTMINQRNYTTYPRDNRGAFTQHFYYPQGYSQQPTGYYDQYPSGEHQCRCPQCTGYGSNDRRSAYCSCTPPHHCGCLIIGQPADTA